MNAALTAEWLKRRTTRTTLGLLLLLLGLVTLATLLHGFGLKATSLERPDQQLRILADAGESLGAVFAALAGALSITGEFRHGTIRPTLLAAPRRSTVLAAKTIMSTAIGIAYGAAAGGTAVALEAIALGSRGIPLQLSVATDLRVIVGGIGAGAFWALVGVGIGAITRNQVATVVGLFVWVLIVENMLIDSAPSVSRFMPGALAQALTGQRTGTLHTIPVVLVVLAAYATAALTAGRLAITHNDVA